jgi:hypothetical protein
LSGTVIANLGGTVMVRPNGMFIAPLSGTVFVLLNGKIVTLLSGTVIAPLNGMPKCLLIRSINCLTGESGFHFCLMHSGLLFYWQVEEDWAH